MEGLSSNLERESLGDKKGGVVSETPRLLPPGHASSQLAGGVGEVEIKSASEKDGRGPVGVASGWRGAVVASGARVEREWDAAKRVDTHTR